MTFTYKKLIFGLFKLNVFWTLTLIEKKNKEWKTLPLTLTHEWAGQRIQWHLQNKNLHVLSDELQSVRGEVKVQSLNCSSAQE